jgi:Flagellar protein FliT
MNQTLPVDELQTALEAIVTDSERMLQAAREGRWDHVLELENERELRMKSFFNTIENGVSVGVNVRTAIERVVAMDRQISVLCEDAKAEVVNSLRDIRNSRSAAAAYLKNATP